MLVPALSVVKVKSAPVPVTTYQTPSAGVPPLVQPAGASVEVAKILLAISEAPPHVKAIASAHKSLGGVTTTPEIGVKE